MNSVLFWRYFSDWHNFLGYTFLANVRAGLPRGTLRKRQPGDQPNSRVLAASEDSAKVGDHGAHAELKAVRRTRTRNGFHVNARTLDKVYDIGRKCSDIFRDI